MVCQTTNSRFQMKSLMLLLLLMVPVVVKARKKAERNVPQNEIRENVKHDIPELDKERIEELWEGIPDHGMKAKTESCFSKGFYILLDLAFSMPTNAPHEIGDEEFLYYWHTAQDDESTDHISEIRIDEVGNMFAKATVTYVNCGTTDPHTLILIPEKRYLSNGHEEYVWVIDDFDKMHNQVLNYINTVGVQFREGLAEKIVNDPFYSTIMTIEEKERYLEEAKAFVKKFNQIFPDGNNMEKE